MTLTEALNIMREFVGDAHENKEVADALSIIESALTTERDDLLDQLGKSRIGTHSAECHTFGPRHYNCLMAKYKAQAAALKIAREALISVWYE